MEGLIARKIDFKVNLGFYWKKLKFWGPIIILKSWFGQIRSLIASLLKFDDQLGTWLKQSETKDQTGKCGKIKGSNYNLFGVLITKL